MSAHTPGPCTLSGVRFKMNGHDFHHINAEAVKGSELSVCSVYYDHKEHGRDFANARLIAAAPDLLSAIEPLLQIYEGTYTSDPHGFASKARAAISKATGEA